MSRWLCIRCKGRLAVMPLSHPDSIIHCSGCDAEYSGVLPTVIKRRLWNRLARERVAYGGGYRLTIDRSSLTVTQVRVRWWEA